MDFEIYRVECRLLCLQAFSVDFEVYRSGVDCCVYRHLVWTLKFTEVESGLLC